MDNDQMEGNGGTKELEQVNKSRLFDLDLNSLGSPV